MHSLRSNPSPLRAVLQAHTTRPLALTFAALSLLVGCGGSATPATTGSAGPAAQTITFAPPATEAYGVAPLALTATASSGLPVTITLTSGPATLSGSTLTIKGIGSIVLLASQPGNASFSPASVTASISISNPNPQPAPSTSVATTMTVAATLEGSFAPNMVGLKFSKSQIKKGYFATGCVTGQPSSCVVNQTTLTFFKTLAPGGGTLGLGQTDEDYLYWAPNGDTVVTDPDIRPIDLLGLAAFMKALGNWKLIYAINLGGMAPTGYTPALVGNTYPTTPALAGQEAVALVQDLNQVATGVTTGTAWTQYLTALEIGNEPDLFQWHESHSYCAAGTSSTICGETGANEGTTPPWTESGTAPYGFEQTWEAIHTGIVSAITAGAYGAMTFVGPDGTNVYTQPSATQPGVNNPTAWTYDFGIDKGAEVSMLTMHYYPFPNNASTQTLLQSAGIDPIMIGPNSGSNNPTQPAGGILHALYNASATTTVPHTYGFDEANSIGGGGEHLVSDSYASTLWIVDFILSVAEGYNNGQPSGGQGGTLTTFTTGGPFGCTGTSVATSSCSASGNYYVPIYDNGQNVGSTPVGVLPDFYGAMFLANHIGSGSMYLSTLSTKGLNVTGYSVYNSTTGALYLVVLNKDASNASINMTATLPSAYSLGQLRVLTQGPGGTTLPTLAAAPLYPGEDVGITIQGQSVNNATGAYTPGTPYDIPTSGNTVSFYVPPLSAVLVQLQP